MNVEYWVLTINDRENQRTEAVRRVFTEEIGLCGILMNEKAPDRQ